MDVSNDVYWRDGMTKAEWTSHPPYGIGSTGEHTHKDIGLMKWEAPCAKLCGETCKSSKSLWKINYLEFQDYGPEYTSFSKVVDAGGASILKNQAEMNLPFGQNKESEKSHDCCNKIPACSSYL